MQKKTEILCGVHNHIYSKDTCCDAETISVRCSNCIHPNDYHEMKCKFFRCRRTK